MAKKNTNIDLSIIAKELGTKPLKTRLTDADYIKYRMSALKGELYEDGSGGMYFKVPGLDCFLEHGDVWSQIKELEERIAAYKALEVDVKKLKKAVARAEKKLPSRPPKHGETNVSKSRKKAR